MVNRGNKWLLVVYSPEIWCNVIILLNTESRYIHENVYYEEKKINDCCTQETCNASWTNEFEQQKTI